jgi:hypothetical protein
MRIIKTTNERNVSSIHEDHKDDENAENGVSLHAPVTFSLVQRSQVY